MSDRPNESRSATAPLREVDLADPVVAWLGSKLEQAMVAAELDLRWGIPDLVGGRPGALTERLDLYPEALPDPMQIAALRAVRTPSTDAELSRLTSVRWSKFRVDILEPMRNGGLLQLDEAGLWTAAGELPRAFDDLIAVELKLKSWRRGIAQARRYRTFANRTYLAMPRTAISPALMELAAQQMVGLLAVDDRQVVEVLNAPREEPLDPGLAAFTSELVLADYLDGLHRRRAGSPRGLARVAAAAA